MFFAIMRFLKRLWVFVLLCFLIGCGASLSEKNADISGQIGLGVQKGGLHKRPVNESVLNINIE